MTWPAAATILVVFSLIPQQSDSRIHDLKIFHDSRTGFDVESFGFAPGGMFSVAIESFEVQDATETVSNPNVGFILRSAKTASAAKALLQLDDEQGLCPFGPSAAKNKTAGASSLFFYTDDPGKWAKGRHFMHVFEDNEAGLYDLEFFNCRGGSHVNFEANVVFANPGPDFLSVGESNLPIMFLLAGIIFLLALILWSYLLFRSPGERFVIHFLMWLLLLFKTLQEFFSALTQRSIQKHGHPFGWDIAYYLFTFLNGLLMFVVILLIGAGWSLLKPFLQPREKRILTIVIPLQLISNIARIYVGETAPGSMAWLTWRDVFTLVDIICCATVLFPLMWSLRNLRESAKDDKMNFDILKLKQFQHFYIVVVSYIYFSRIVVYLLDSTMPYQLAWVSVMSPEAATFLFYFTTGYYFRPVPNNPYLTVSHFDEESEDEETASFGTVEQ